LLLQFPHIFPLMWNPLELIVCVPFRIQLHFKGTQDFRLKYRHMDDFREIEYLIQILMEIKKMELYPKGHTNNQFQRIPHQRKNKDNLQKQRKNLWLISRAK